MTQIPEAGFYVQNVRSGRVAEVFAKRGKRRRYATSHFVAVRYVNDNGRWCYPLWHIHNIRLVQ
ncbi:MAG: hypothetical protein RL681_251 [Candidatus Parcubacteria bacterium]|jgi:hypothetical protein